MEIKNIVNPALGGCLAEIVMMPVCTSKTMYQNTEGATIKGTISNIYNKNGLKGFYRASAPAIFSQGYTTASRFFLYRFLNEKSSNKFVNGAVAGFLTSLMVHPFDNYRIHLQMNANFRQVVKDNGLSVLYRGYSKTLTKFILGSTLFFPIYDTIKEKVESPMYCSLATAVISTSILQPIDYLKVRHTYGLSYFNGWNPKTYYKGFSLNLMKVVPHFMIIMTTIEYLNKLY